MQEIRVPEHQCTKAIIALDTMVDQVDHHFRTAIDQHVCAAQDESYNEAHLRAKEEHEEQLRQQERAQLVYEAPIIGEPAQDPQAKASTKWFAAPNPGVPCTSPHYDGTFSTAIIKGGQLAHAQPHGQPGQEQYVTVTDGTKKLACASWLPQGDMFPLLAQMENTLEQYCLKELDSLYEELTHLQQWLISTDQQLPETMEELPPVWPHLLFQFDVGGTYQPPHQSAKNSRYP